MRVTDFSGSVRDIPANTLDLWRALNSGLPYCLSRGTVPDPYSSDVAYRKEPRIGSGKRAEIWRPWWQVQSARWGDCEDLSCWLACWLRQSGDQSAHIGLIEFPAGGWHAVTVTRRAPLRPTPGAYPATQVASRYPGASIMVHPDAPSLSGWWVYDVSYAHGMRDPGAATVYAPGVVAGQREPLDDAYQPGLDPYYSAGISGISDWVADVPAWVWVAGLLGVGAVAGRVTAPPAITDAYLLSLPWSSVWLPLWGSAAARRMVEISRELGLPNPASLLGVMYHETGGTFSPAVTNPSSGATGLIQFMPSTAKRLGTTTALLRQMSARDQLEYVRSYLLPGAPYADAASVYDYVFMPGRVTRRSGILAERGETDSRGKPLRYYEGNTSLDVDGDGYIRRGEPGAVALAHLRRNGFIGALERGDDPPELREWRKNPTAGYAVKILSDVMGRTYDPLMLRQLRDAIVFMASLDPLVDASEHDSYIAGVIRRASGLRGSADTDPSWGQTAENLSRAVTVTAQTVKPLAEATVSLAAAGAEAGAGVLRKGLPDWVWIAAGLGGLWYFWRSRS